MAAKPPACQWQKKVPEILFLTLKSNPIILNERCTITGRMIGLSPQQLHDLLSSNSYTLAVIRENQVVFHSQERGIKPLYTLYQEQPELLKGALVADKVTGKAAAVLSVLCGVKEVYSDLISEHALEVLQQGGVKASYLQKTPYIINRTKTGMCPMETLVLSAESPEEAAERLQEFFKQTEQRA